MCILSVYTLLRAVGYYDLSVLSMSVMGFQKRKKFGWGVGGWGKIYPILFGFFEFFNFAKPLSNYRKQVNQIEVSVKRLHNG